MLPSPRPSSFRYRAQRRSAFCLAGLAMIWVSLEAWQAGWSASTSGDRPSPPRFLVDLAVAETEELLLLPHVGPKTAQAWLSSREPSDQGMSRQPEDLHLLPGVGPKRSLELAPHLLDSAR
jgi:DNA uptake protein ComE-like DNA-binding protein